jgi:hypothetical protein
MQLAIAGKYLLIIELLSLRHFFVNLRKEKYEVA